MFGKKLVQGFVVVAALAVSAASAHAQHKQVRDGFWFSGGLGYGSLGCDNCGSREGGVSGDISVGGTISPRFLLGVGAAGWSKSDQGARLTVSTLDARVRFYPSRTSGLFLTGGIGLGTVRGDFGGGFSATETGVGTILGLGWDIRVARNTSITPYWNGFAMKNSNTDANVGQAGLAITLH
jgi:outer membrane protein with beta-barrel domain